MTYNRPIIKLTVSRFDRILDSLALSGILLMWIYTISAYGKLPDIIPVHFNVQGDVDNYGNKATLFILPAIITIVVAGMTLLNRYPHIFNYLQKITEDNAVHQYTIATRLIRIIKLVIVIFSLIILYDIISSAKATHSTLGWWLIPGFMLSMLLPVFVSIYLSSQGKKNNNSGKV